MNTEASGPITSRTIFEWISGGRTEFQRIFFVAPGADPAGLDRILRPDDAVLLPADCDWSSDHGRVLSYTGQMVDAGDELFVNDGAIELQDYISAGFVEIVGPTAVRFFDLVGWQAFLSDADLTRRTGVFPSALIDPRVLLADREMFVRSDPPALPRALRLEADGTIGLGMQGVILGTTDNWESALSGLVASADVLGGVIDPVIVRADLVAHRWLPRFLHATDLIKTLQLNNGTVKIDGFGWSNLEDNRADAEPLPADPFMLETADGLILADITSRRRQLLTPSTAEVVSAVQTSSSLKLARNRVSARRDIDDTAAARLCDDAIELLNVNVGRQSDAPLTILTEQVR